MLGVSRSTIARRMAGLYASGAYEKRRNKDEDGAWNIELGAWCMAHGAAQTQTETIALGVGSDQCLSEPTDLVQNRLVGAVQAWEVEDLTSLPPLEPGEFTYAVFGDTQNYHMQGDVYTNQSFSTRVDWLIRAETVRLQNIRFISHLGDVVDGTDDERQWTLASNQVARLKDARFRSRSFPATTT